MKINLVDFKEKVSFLKVFIFFLSLAVVGFGTPAWSSFLGVFASTVGLSCFWFLLKDVKTNQKKFLISLLWFFGIQVIHLSWMSATEYQGSYIFIVYFLLSLALGAQFAWLSLYVPFRREEFTLSKVLALCGFWVLLEWSRLFILSGFPFNPIGLALSSTLIGRQGAALLGVYGLTFWVLLTNLYGLSFLLFREKKLFFVWLFLALSPYLYGYAHYTYHKAKMSQAESIKALLIQTALSPVEKTGIRGYEYMMPPLDQWRAIFSYLAPHKNQDHHLLVLPERSVPFSDSTKLYPIELVRHLVYHFFGKEALSSLPKTQEKVVDNLYMSQFLANFFKAEVIVGLEYLEDLLEGEYKAFASAFCFHPNAPYEVYHKQILLPIVEYLPFQWCRDLAKRHNICGWYEKGSSAGLFKSIVPISPSICIEELYGSLLRKNRLLGARLLVNMTNDVWFPNSKLPRQHFEHGLLRCLENGLPAVRSCNTGITVAVDALGQPLAVFGGLAKKDQWERGALSASIPNYCYTTPFSLYGNTLIVALSVFALALSIFGKLSNFRTNSISNSE